MVVFVKKKGKKTKREIFHYMVVWRRFRISKTTAISYQNKDHREKYSVKPPPKYQEMLFMKRLKLEKGATNSLFFHQNCSIPTLSTSSSLWTCKNNCCLVTTMTTIPSSMLLLNHTITTTDNFYVTLLNN